jgi:hypothetical protein
MPSYRHEPRADALDRRSAIRLAGGATVGVLALGAAAGCTGDDVVHEPDPLAAQEVAARADAAAATAAIAVAPDRHAALTAIAAERTAHADALRSEIDRRHQTGAPHPRERIRPIGRGLGQHGAARYPAERRDAAGAAGRVAEIGCRSGPRP